jgi:hypothetical protein
MMGMRMPETCWAVFKRQVINLRSCCILLVDSVESMRMHGFANPKLHNFITIRIFTAALYDISLDVARVCFLFFALNTLMHAFLVHCFVNWHIKFAYERWLDIEFNVQIHGYILSILTNTIPGFWFRRGVCLPVYTMKYVLNLRDVNQMAGW